mgnify:CR=1 FL=1
MDLSKIMRIARGHYSQREWGALLGVHPQTVWRWEKQGIARRHFPHVLEAVRLRPDLARAALVTAIGTTRDRFDRAYDPRSHDRCPECVVDLCQTITGLEEDEIQEWIRLG